MAWMGAVSSILLMDPEYVDTACLSSLLSQSSKGGRIGVGTCFKGSKAMSRATGCTIWLENKSPHSLLWCLLQQLYLTLMDENVCLYLLLTFVDQAAVRDTGTGDGK